MDNWTLISIKQGYPFINIYCSRITTAEYPIHRYPCLDINVEIHTCVNNWRLTFKIHGYPCWYPWIFGNPCTDMLWILGPGTTLPWSEASSTYPIIAKLVSLLALLTDFFLDQLISFAIPNNFRTKKACRNVPAVSQPITLAFINFLMT